MKASKRSTTAVKETVRGFGHAQLLTIAVFVGIPVLWAVIAPDNFWHTMIELGSMGTGPRLWS
jgi:hypothetical protein